ncbi:MAG: hypothetical protein R6V83_04230 [Candidatus Thorarchaeota archaeon]
MGRQPGSQSSSFGGSCTGRPSRHGFAIWNDKHQILTGGIAMARCIIVENDRIGIDQALH